jgi:hypothetical protein
MTIRKRHAQSTIETLALALECTEDALAQVARIAIEEIHSSLETSSHVQAAERDMRSALRQLVLAERELRSRAGVRPRLDEPSEGVARVVPGPGSDGARSGV